MIYYYDVLHQHEAIYQKQKQKENKKYRELRK
jgi:hypothetical protein